MTASRRTRKIQLVRETTMIKEFGVASGRWSGFEIEEMAQRCDALAISARRRCNTATCGRGRCDHAANAMWWTEGAAAWRRLSQPRTGEASGS